MNFGEVDRWNNAEAVWSRKWGPVSRIEGVGYGCEMAPVGLSFDEVDRRGLSRLCWIHVEPAKGVRLCGLRIMVWGLELAVWGIRV